jgi:predicted membrane protein
MCGRVDLRRNARTGPLERTGGVSDLVLGIVIMVLGAMLMLDRLDIVDAASSLAFYPLALLGAGVMVLTKSRDGGARFWGYVFILLGAWLSLSLFGVVRVGFWEFLWPLLLVLVGVNLIQRRAKQTAPAPPRPARALGSSMVSVLGDARRRSDDKPFRGMQMTAILGNCTLDLRHAAIEPGQEATIEVFALLGSQEIVVPSGWTVVSKVSPLAASIDDSRLPPLSAPVPAAPQPVAPRLILKGAVILSGLTIKN